MRPTVFTCIVYGLGLAAAACSDRPPPPGISRAQAENFAKVYFGRCVGGCGGVSDEAVEHAEYWVVDAAIGVGGFPGVVRVDKKTGAVSLSGYPTLLPGELAFKAP